MENLDGLINWLIEYESALSAIAAATVILGVFYGFLRFVFAPIVRRYNALRRQRKIALTKERNQAKQTSSRSKSTTLHSGHNSVSVMLFDCKSSNPDDQYLASGITSEIIAHITKVPSLRVSSRAASYGFVSNQTDVKEVAESLHTRYILAGSLHHSAGRIRVIAHLYDAQQDRDIWAEQYDRDIEYIFDVQHEIAQCIVGAILGEVKMAESLVAQETPTQQLDAWGLVQKAYFFWLVSFSPQAMLDACELLRKAIEIDPEYATAKAALAMILANQMTMRIAPDYEAAAKEAREMIESAFKQAPNDIDVLENAGVTWQNLGEKMKAEMALRKVVKLTPLNLIARGYLALLLALTKGVAGAEEALALLSENIAIAPTHPATPYWEFFMAVAEQARGHQQASINQAHASLSGQPGWAHNYFVLANAYCELGRPDEARSAIASAEQINPYLTAELYADNINRITGDAKMSKLFTGGLKRHKLI